MTEEELDFHLRNIAHQLYHHLEADGRFQRNRNPVIPSILAEIYKPLVRHINEEYNKEMQLAMEKIAELEAEVVNVRMESGFKVAGEVNGKILYMRRDGIDG